jgi:hypothetical protein
VLEFVAVFVYDIPKELKSKVHLSLVRPVLTCGCEAWTLTKTDEVTLGSFERKILRKIYGPIEERGEWRIRYSHELYQLYKLRSIVKVVKFARLQWAGHLKGRRTQKFLENLWNGSQSAEKCWATKTSMDAWHRRGFKKNEN